MTPLPGDHFRSATGPAVGPAIGPTIGQVPGKTRLRIRRATEDDLPHLARLDEQAFPHGPYPFFVLRQLLTAFPDFLLLVEEGRELHGYVLASPPHEAQSWVLSLAIAPALRGQGLGRQLMTGILGHLRGQGTHSVWLSVEPGNETAVALYLSLGFVPDPGGPRKDYFGPGEDRLLMSLTL
ncbi:GNAT family N-acetyltransferase [Streptomyces sp. NPDC005811]|uniref:GNAT family N-acetyltransferase n=1 Tax=Streptomyces sp. NPDC005811 TaxID=3154565 RepID=UPI003401BD14